MAFKSNNKTEGLPLSSTPIQSLEDSGYCGSGQRKYLSVVDAKVLSTCSPIKEYTFKYPATVCLKDHSIISLSKNAFDYENITNFEISATETSEMAHPKLYGSKEPYKPKSENFLYAPELSFQNPSFNFCLQREKCDSFDSSSNNDIRYNLFGHQSEDLTVSVSYDPRNSDYSDSLISLVNKKSAYSQKQNFKQRKINFIAELKSRNCISLISTILSYLSPKELCQASCVNRDWNEAILEDRKARSRKEIYVAERTLFLTGPSKENRLGMRNGPVREHKKALCSVTNTVNRTIVVPNNKYSKSRFDSFTDEVKNGENIKLFKCPKCFYASKLESDTNYICTHCSYKFCSKCLNPIFNLKNHTCCEFQLPRTTIGSKQSKKNLRRL